MPWSQVQDIQQQNGAADPQVLAYVSDVTAGNLLVCEVGLPSVTVTVSGITDDLGNTWALAKRQVGSGVTATSEIWWAVSVGSGPNELTIDLSASSLADLGLFEATPPSGYTIAVDQTGGTETNAGSDHPCSAADLTGTQNDVYGTAISRNTSGTFVVDATESPWVNDGNTSRGMFQHAIYTSAPTTNANWTSSVNETEVSAMVLFKATALGGGLDIPIAYHHYRTMHGAH